MLRAAVVVPVLARSLTSEREGASGAAPARLRVRIDSSLWAEGVSLGDALELVLMQASAEGHSVSYVEDDSIHVARR